MYAALSSIINSYQSPCTYLVSCTSRSRSSEIFDELKRHIEVGRQVHRHVVPAYLSRAPLVRAAVVLPREIAPYNVNRVLAGDR